MLQTTYYNPGCNILTQEKLSNRRFTKHLALVNKARIAARINHKVRSKFVCLFLFSFISPLTFVCDN